MESERLHREAVVVDCHNDLPVKLIAWHRSLAKWGVGNADCFAEWILECRAGGVDVQVMPICVGPAEAEAALRRVLLQLEYLRREIEQHGGEVMLCRSGAEIDAAVASGKIALVIALEGCAAIGLDIELLGLFFRLGVRMASFTHLGRTLLADGTAEEETGSRLPQPGKAALREMERLGMLMDVSHLSRTGVEHVLEIATRPVVASHSSARAICDHHRNLDDDLLRGIATTGGVVGINFIPVFIDRHRPTLDRIADHVEHVAGVAGIDHVGIGPDFIKAYFDAVYPQFPSLKLEGGDLKDTIPGMAGTRDLPNLTAALLARGFSAGAIRKILGENFLRLFRQHLRVSSTERATS